MYLHKFLKCRLSKLPTYINIHGFFWMQNATKYFKLYFYMWVIQNRVFMHIFKVWVTATTLLQ
jgi:hypothetical protein